MTKTRLAVAVTPNDGADLQRITERIYVGVSGNVAAVLVDSPATVTFTAMPVGFHDICAKRILATGTTATNILAIY